MVTAKQITAEDRGAQRDSGKAVNIVEKSGFNRATLSPRSGAPCHHHGEGLMARILIIEDNTANMKLATLLLRNAGHTVLARSTPRPGSTLARTEQPHLILMDIQLPGMDGLAATALLEAGPGHRRHPDHRADGDGDEGGPGEEPAAGCDAYIAKPLRYQELLCGDRRAAWPWRVRSRHDRRPRPSSSSTTMRRTASCSRRC